MTLFVTSSPFDTDADRPRFWEKNDFAHRLRESVPPFPFVTFVAADQERHDLTCQFGADVFCALTDAGIYPASYHVLDESNMDEAEALVDSSDLLVFSGGHVPTQASFFEEMGLRELLRAYDGVILGISAGSMNMANTVYAQPEEPGEAADPNYLRFFPGLDLTQVQILPHYPQWADKILDGLHLMQDVALPDSVGNCFFVLCDGSYFYQDADKLLLLGESLVIQDGSLTPLLEDGEILNMAFFD